jgi:hypothetical protein
MSARLKGADPVNLRRRGRRVLNESRVVAQLYSSVVRYAFEANVTLERSQLIHDHGLRTTSAASLEECVAASGGTKRSAAVPPLPLWLLLRW